MADIGLDYAGSSPGAAAVKNADYQFVARYLSRYTAKCISKAEYDDMNGNGVGVVVVFEDYANQALGGYEQGVKDAQYALQQARGVGVRDDRPIYFAVDFDINDAQKPVAGEYMKGVAAVIGLSRVGAYGGYWWVKYCADNGLATYFWQAVAWSGGNRDSRAHLFQRLGGTVVNGTSCDINDALQPDYGQSNFKGNKDMATQQQIDDAISVVNQVGWATAPAPAIFDNERPYLANDFVGGIIQILHNADVDPNSAKNLVLATRAELDKLKAQLTAVQGQDDADKAALATALARIQTLQDELAKQNSPAPLPDPNGVTITPKGWAALWETIKAFFGKNK